MNLNGKVQVEMSCVSCGTSIMRLTQVKTPKCRECQKKENAEKNKQYRVLYKGMCATCGKKIPPTAHKYCNAMCRYEKVEPKGKTKWLPIR